MVFAARAQNHADVDARQQQAYHLHIQAIEGSLWEVKDERGNRSIVSPMDGEHFKQWFMGQYAEVIAEHLQTSEA